MSPSHTTEALRLPLRSLVIEDQPHDFELLEAALRRGGFEPESRRVENEEEFLAALEWQPTIVLSDYSLPNFTGVQALSLLHERAIDIPFILISGTIGEEVAVEAMRLGAADYLLKDRLERLAPAVRQALEKSKLRSDYRAAQLALAASEAQLREAQSLAKLGSWSWDIERNQVSWSDCTRALFGLHEGSQPLTYERFLELVHPDDRACIDASVRAALETRGSYEGEYRIVHPDGTVHHAHARGVVQADDAGKPIRMFGCVQDITERKQAEDQLLRAQRLENLGHLAAGIAHDLNNILAPIMMVAPLLRHHIPDEADHRLLGVVEQSARRGAGLVRQILSFAQGSGGGQVPIQLKHVARDIFAMISETFPRNVRISSDIAPDLWPSSANPTEIHQVLLNLCINARDAMPEGGELSLRIANSALDAATAAAIPHARPGHFVVVDVADTGTGIAPELQERIWEPFFTTKREGKGTGIGLSTIRNILSRHRGFVDLRSAPGIGTKFSVYLPAEPAASELADGSSSPFEATPLGNGETILVVDDEVDVRNLVCATLARNGYRTLTARDGEEALGLFTLHQGCIGLVITDQDMPGFSGDQLIAALRQSRPETKCLVCTGTAPRQRIVRQRKFCSSRSSLEHCSPPSGIFSTRADRWTSRLERGQQG